MSSNVRNKRLGRTALIAVAALAILAMTLYALSMSAQAASPAGRATATPAPPGLTVVTLGFDDGFNDAYAARAILSAHGMHGTFFINSGVVGDSTHMTWAQLQDLYADGNEIAGHGLTHASLKSLKGYALLHEVCDDRVNLFNQGFQPTSFAYPFGSYNSTTQQALQTCGYNSGRTVCCGPDTIPPGAAYATDAMPSVKGSHTLADLQGWVTQTEQAGGGWAQFVFHHVCDGCDVYSVSPATLTAFLDWLQPRVASGTVVSTTHEVVGGPINPPVPAQP
jgi:peptidoglycan/xylan/chitin deacetylase (PgdA/CDA1 family)